MKLFAGPGDFLKWSGIGITTVPRSLGSQENTLGDCEGVCDTFDKAAQSSEKMIKIPMAGSWKISLVGGDFVTVVTHALPILVLSFTLALFFQFTLFLLISRCIWRHFAVH